MRPRFLVVGGLPGAGKSVLLRRLRSQGVQVLDPDRIRRWCAAQLPESIPYRYYRPVVHLAHRLQIVWTLIRRREDVAVQSTATRQARRVWLGRIAQALGWEPRLILVDTPPGQARADQYLRGRVLGESSFDAHVARWAATQLPDRNRVTTMPGWPWVIVTDRSGAPAAADAALGRRITEDDKQPQLVS